MAMTTLEFASKVVRNSSSWDFAYEHPAANEYHTVDVLMENIYLPANVGIYSAEVKVLATLGPTQDIKSEDWYTVHVEYYWADNNLSVSPQSSGNYTSLGTLLSFYSTEAMQYPESRYGQVIIDNTNAVYTEALVADTLIGLLDPAVTNLTWRVGYRAWLNDDDYYYKLFWTFDQVQVCLSLVVE